MLHSMGWKGETDDWKGNTVGVISGIGIARILLYFPIPGNVHFLGPFGHTNRSALQPTVKRVVDYIRSKTSISRGYSWLDELIGKELTDTGC